MLSDLGLYYAKGHGRNMIATIVPTETMPKDQDELQKMASSLEYALERGFLAVRAEGKVA